MERAVAAVPPERYGDAVRRGERLLRRRRLARRALWLLACAAVLAFAVWAADARPWVEPPSRTTPPVTGW
jgi:ferric-dicitrate binding protein FerR (iron transport regulator)